MDKNAMFAVVMFVVLVFGVAAFMEMYKKLVRKDRAKIWEIRLVAALLSGLSGLVLYKVLDVSSFQYVKDGPWLTVVYGLATYILQLPVCMSVMKKMWVKIEARISKKLEG